METPLTREASAFINFRDDYAGGGVVPDGPRQGPYWLRLVAPDVYKAVSRDKSAHVLWEWANRFGADPVLVPGK